MPTFFIEIIMFKVGFLNKISCAFGFFFNFLFFIAMSSCADFVDFQNKPKIITNEALIDKQKKLEVES